MPRRSLEDMDGLRLAHRSAYTRIPMEGPRLLFQPNNLLLNGEAIVYIPLPTQTTSAFFGTARALIGVGEDLVKRNHTED